MTPAAIWVLAGLLAPAAPSGWDGSCENHGVVVQAGAENRYACAGPCANHGIIVMAGPGNEHACAGPCSNEGLLVNVGGSHCGGPPVQACLGEACVQSCPGCLRAEAACHAGPGHGPGTLTVACGDPGKPCGVAREPACWTVRQACHDLGGPVEQATQGRVRCEGQPGSLLPEARAG
jgi:hypothetical protein